MNSSHNSGAINKMMLLNIFLLIIIVAIVYVLLAPKPPTSSMPVAAPTAPATLPAPSPQAKTSNNTKTEIDTLEKQLQRENKRLQALRAQQQKVESLRKASEQQTQEQVEGSDTSN